MISLLDDYVHLHGEETGGDVFIGEGFQHNFAVFRGTEVGDTISWRDIWTDLKFALRSVDKKGMRLHSGFFEAWQELAPKVYQATGALQYTQAQERFDHIEQHGEEHAPVVKPWVFTGHSLGAAMATIAAAAFKPAECVTFGGPRVGGSKFVKVAEDSCNIRRYVNAGDWCPSLPPGVFGHRHAGELNFIDRSGALRVNPPSGVKLRERLLDLPNRWSRHGAGAYADRLENLL